MSDLFNTGAQTPAPDTAPRPLAERLRPKTLAEVIGQPQVLGPEAPLGVMLGAGSLSSLIFWGPPGVGKTTIARLLADETDLHFVQISAIFSGVPELRKVFDAAKHRRTNGQGTLLFVDEIHRFNKAQQDGFLPHMEDGTILLVGATTENPSFELNAALLSRSQVLVLERLKLSDLEVLTQRAEGALKRTLPLDGPAREALLEMADGDGRALLNLIEQVAAWKVDGKLNSEALAKRLRLNCITGRSDVGRLARRKGISIEMAAREARYRFLARTAREAEATAIATAHTADDQAETILLNLARGAGAAGLAGIPYMGRHALKVVRPLRDVGRASVERFLVSGRLAWREAATNADPAVLRNRVRHEVLPFLEKRLNPGIRLALLRASDILASENEWLNVLAKKILGQ
jgi:tRNA(Ile)-lysidine synthetase-like protein